MGTMAAACSGRPRGEGAGYAAAMNAESEPEVKGTVSARLLRLPRIADASHKLGGSEGHPHFCS